MRHARPRALCRSGSSPKSEHQRNDSIRRLDCRFVPCHISSNELSALAEHEEPCMRIDDHRRSTNFEDRGRGGGGGGGIPVRGLASLVRMIGIKGTLIVGVIGAAVFFFLPSGLKQQVLAALSGG